MTSIQSNDLRLLNKVAVMADLYYLPLRISKLLGWIASSIIIESLIPTLDDGNDSLRFSLAATIIERYSESLVAVSDEQAPSLYIFLKACLLKDKRDLAERVITPYFANFAEKRGNVCRAGIDGIQAFRYIMSLGPEEFRSPDWRPANPSYLLSVLLLYGEKLGLKDIWDLRGLDRLWGAFFIPQNYRHFGRKAMEPGINYTQQIGFGIWSLSDFKKDFQRATAMGFSADTRSFPKEGAALCSMASLLFPDRVPLLLEALL